VNPTLVRAIGRWSLAALVLNSVIGSSVFGLPSVIAGNLGAASPWAWLLAAIGIGIIVACFAEVTSRFSEAGGPYLYARLAFGRLAGIEMGWMAYLVRITASATNANLFVIYLAELWPGAEGPIVSRLVLAALLFPLAAINWRGVTHGARISAMLIAAKLLPLLIFLLAGIGFLLRHAAVVPTAPPVTAHPWLDSILLLVFAYGGFEAALVPLGEARDPERDAPFALFLTLGVCAVLYCLVQVVVLATLTDPAAAPRPLAAAAQVFLGTSGALLMAGAALLSVAGYLAGGMVNVPRLTFAMAERSDLPDLFARVHPRFRTPYVSIGVYAILVWLLAATGGFLQNLSLSAVSRLFTYGVVCVALPVFRARDGKPGAPAMHPARFRLPLGGVWAVLGAGFSLVLSTRMSAQELRVLALTLILGLVHWWWVRRKTK
jgi:amino acid transporter